MGQIALQAYLNQVDGLIDENRLGEAIAHCQHILRQHPRHVETYRLLGKTLLEQQSYGDAAEIFQRVLSADPEDFIAHAGLSIIYKESGELSRAIWHMERAFEIEPYNSAIREELREMYARRDGLKPDRLPLTRGALARLYVRGDVLQRATAELQHVLAEYSERVDMQALLAEALWRNDQRMQAVDVCLDILDKLPNCIKANAILAETWLTAGRVNESQKYVERLNSLTLLDQTHLDPESVVGRVYQADVDGGLSLPETILVDELDYVPAAGLAEEADWVHQVGVGADTGEILPEWLQQMGDEGIGAPGEVELAPDEELDVRGWLSDLAPEGDDELESLAEEESGFEPAGERQKQSIKEEETVSPDTSGEVAEPEPSVPQEVLDWLSELDAPPAKGLKASVEEPETVDDNDDWLSELVGGLGAEEKVGEASPLSVREGPDDEGAGEEFELTETQREEALPAEPESGTAELVKWFSEQEEAPAEEADSEQLPDWLSEPAEGAADQSPDWLSGATISPRDEAKLPDWLRDTLEPSEELAEAGKASERHSETQDTEISGERPPASFEVLEEQTMGEQEVPKGDRPDDSEEGDKTAESLEELAEEPQTLTEEPQPSGDEVETVVGPSPADDEIPDWLQMDLEDSAPSEEDLPDWLTEPPDSSEMLDELELPGAEVFEETDATVVSAEGIALPSEDIPDWLRDQMPEDLEGQPESGESDELSWLDQIAAGEGAPIEEPPTMSWDESEGDEGREEPDFEAELAEDDLAWLEELEVPSEPDGEQTEETTAQAAEEPEMEAAPEDFPEDVPEDMDEAMAWLEQLAARQGAKAEELPTLSEQIEPVAEAPADAGEKPAFELGGADDLEAELFEDVGVLDLEALGAEEILDEPLPLEEADLAVEIPEDPDEAMAWLEDLAVKQGAPLEELPSLTSESEGEPTVEPLTETEEDLELELAVAELAGVEMPRSASEALSWLDELASSAFQLAEETVAPEAEWPESIPALEPEPAWESEGLDMEMVEELPETMVEPFDEPTTALEESVPPDVEILEEARLAADVSVEEPPEPLEEPLAAPTAHDALEAEVRLADEMPEDPDEAMAWLERLAARQGAPLEELPTVDSVEEEIAMPDWVAREAAEPEAEEEEEPLLVSDFEIDVEAALDTELETDEVSEAEPSTESEAESESEPEPGLELTGEDVGDSLPDWLALEPTGEMHSDDLDWLDSLEDTSLDSWLGAEEDASLTGIRLTDLEAEQELQPDTSFEFEEPGEALEEPAVEAEVGPDLLEGVEAVDQEQLNQARSAIEIGNLDDALNVYSSLLDAGEGLPLVIAELESAVTKHGERPALRRLLGDAYARNGQLQKALEVYRQALDQL